MLGAGTRRRLVRTAATAAALLVVGLGATPSWATTTSGVTGRIDGFSANPDGSLAIGFSAPGLASGQSIDPKTVKVTVNGTEVPATAATASAETAPKRSSVLTIDVSGSMKGDPLASAQTAAKSYVANLPDDVLVGLVTFGTDVTVVQTPTKDRGKINRAIDGITAGGATALYNAVIKANEVLGPDGFRSQLLLSDGDNNSATGTEGQALVSIKASGATFDAVALDPNTVPTLTTLANAGGGQVVPISDAEQLNDVFTAAADAQAKALVVTAQVPAELAGAAVTVGVTATAAGQNLSDQALYVPRVVASPSPTFIVGPSPIPAPAPTIFTNSWVLPVGLALLGLGLFAILGVAFLATDRDSQQTGRLRRRLARYSLTSRAEQPATPTSGALGDTGVARSAVELAGRVTQRADIDTGLALKLEAAGVPLKPAEWLLLHVGATLGLALLFALLSGFGLVATLVGFAIGFLVPYAYLAIKDERRKARFAAQLPDTLQLLAGSLAAGYSLVQAIDTVVRESDGPMAAELNRAIVEARLGVPIEDALDTVARRMNSVDFAWVVMAVRIQREVGGNLAEVLSSVAATMRERERLRRQVEVLSAEGRLSAVILALLPILFIVYLVVARPEYLSVLYTTPLGILMIIVALVLLTAGVFWLRKVVKVEV